MTMIKSIVTTCAGYPHPLESVVWSAFAERENHDATSLAWFLKNAHVLAKGGTRAYHTAAKDVLNYMDRQGLLERDSYGWYRLRP